MTIHNHSNCPQILLITCYHITKIKYLVYLQNKVVYLVAHQKTQIMYTFLSEYLTKNSLWNLSALNSSDKVNELLFINLFIYFKRIIRVPFTFSRINNKAPN